MLKEYLHVGSDGERHLNEDRKKTSKRSEFIIGYSVGPVTSKLGVSTETFNVNLSTSSPLSFLAFIPNFSEPQKQTLVRGLKVCSSFFLVLYYVCLTQCVSLSLRLKYVCTSFASIQPVLVIYCSAVVKRVSSLHYTNARIFLTAAVE